MGILDLCLKATKMKAGAVFDPTHTYRYLLWREWNPTQPRVVFVMLNPSTADAEINDATIRCCIRFAQSWGYGALEVVNLFALIATHPQQLKQASIDPIGQECDRYLLEAADRAEQLIVAWGNWGSLHARDRSVLNLLTSHQIYCVGRNRSGQPRHPLYLPQRTKAVPFGNFEF